MRGISAPAILCAFHGVCPDSFPGNASFFYIECGDLLEILEHPNSDRMRVSERLIVQRADDVVPGTVRVGDTIFSHQSREEPVRVRWDPLPTDAYGTVGKRQSVAERSLPSLPSLNIQWLVGLGCQVFTRAHRSD